MSGAVPPSASTIRAGASGSVTSIPVDAAARAGDDGRAARYLEVHAGMMSG
jgi:hypothetical protein